jgi:hypothetical protein
MADTIDEDFKAFCEELRNGTDIDPKVLEAGVKKYGFRHLSGAQKAMFQAAIFPKSRTELGFQDLKKVNQTLRVMQQMYKSGALSKEDLTAFLTESQRIPNKKDPKRGPRHGKSLLMVIATNTYAAEFKDKKYGKKLKEEGISDDLRNDLNKLRQKLSDNTQTFIEIQNTLGELDPEILNEVFNYKDTNTGRVIKYADLAKKSVIMKDNLEKSEQHTTPQQSTALQEQQENSPAEAPVRFGGLPEENSDTLTFSTQPENLNVAVNKPEENTPQNNPDETDENVADLDDPGKDSKHGKKALNWDPVSEQDIIKYLYNVWFLGGLNYVMKKAFKMVDGTIDYLCSDGGETPRKYAKAKKTPSAANNNAPATAPAAGESTLPAMNSQERENFNTFIRQINDMANPIAANLVDLGKIFKKPEVLAAMGKCIEANIGKEPGEWKVTDVSLGKLFNPVNNKQFIKLLNNAYRANPAMFKQRLREVLSKPDLLKQCMHPNNFKLCAQLATVEYALKHPGQSLNNNEEAAKEIRAQTMIKSLDMMENAQLIMDRKLNDFRVTENKEPNDKQYKAMQEASVIEFAKYLEDVSYATGDLKIYLGRKQAMKDPTQQQLLDQEIRQSKAELDKLLNQYRSPEDEADKPRETAPKTKKEPVGMVEEAHKQNAGLLKEANINGNIETEKKSMEAEKEVVAQRSAEVQAFKQKHFGKEKAMQQTDIRTNKKAGKDTR